MPGTNWNLMKAAKQLEQVKADVRARTERATDDDGNLNSEMFKYRNPEITVPMHEWLKERYDEAEKLQAEVDDYTKSESLLTGFDNLDSIGREKGRRPALNGQGKMLGLSDALVKSEAFDNFTKSLKMEPSTNMGIKAMSFDHEIGLKTLFTSDPSGTNVAGTVNVESIRTGEFEMLPRTRVTLMDIIPQAETMFPVVKYDAETLNESNVQDIAQGALYSESAFTIEERTVDVEKSGAFIQISEEVMQDRPEMRARLDGSLMSQLMRRVQDDIVGAAAIVNPGEYVGTPAVGAINGFLETTGLNAYDGSGVNQVEALYRAAELVYRNGQTEANAIVMNSQDWADMQSLQSTTGSFVLPGALSPLWAPRRMQIGDWPVVLCNALPQRRVLIGDFANHCMIRDRQTAQVRIQEAQGITGVAPGAAAYTQPTGRFNIYCDVRYAFYVRRPLAFTDISNFGV